jgi:hypothetical protein
MHSVGGPQLARLREALRKPSAGHQKAIRRPSAGHQKAISRPSESHHHQAISGPSSGHALEAYFSPEKDIFTARATWTHHRATLAPLALLLEDAWGQRGAPL